MIRFVAGLNVVTEMPGRKPDLAFENTNQYFCPNQKNVVYSLNFALCFGDIRLQTDYLACDFNRRRRWAQNARKIQILVELLMCS